MLESNDAFLRLPAEGGTPSGQPAGLP